MIDMSRWTVSGYRASKRQSRETTAYTATLCVDGKPFATASNSGTGGCDLYRPYGPDYRSHRDLIDALEADATVWACDAGWPFAGSGENTNVWINWFVRGRKQHISPREWCAVGVA